MRLVKKLCSAVAVLALVATAIPMNASAAADVLDFEDGKVPVGIQMATNDDGTPDGDPSVLSVVDFNGSKMLKIDSQENGTPKVKFMLLDLVGEENFAKVTGIEYDLIIEQTDGRMVEWNGGVVGATPTGPSGWANGMEWTIDYWEAAVSESTHLSHTLGKDFLFTDSTKAFFMFMNWANNGTDMYIDNVRLLGADGKAIELTGVGAVAAEAITASVPKTGTTNNTVFFALSAAAMFTVAVALKKKKFVEA